MGGWYSFYKEYRSKTDFASMTSRAPQTCRTDGPSVCPNGRFIEDTANPPDKRVRRVFVCVRLGALFLTANAFSGMLL